MRVAGRQFLAIIVPLTLAGCFFSARNDEPINNFNTPDIVEQPGPMLVFTFQNGQQAQVLLGKKHEHLKEHLLAWIQQGVYRNSPVYRQVPGDFLLTGKPRMAGWGFVKGMYLENLAKQPSARYGQVGLIVHADGTVGPELIIKYGFSAQNCCLDPANVQIGKIITGKAALGKVKLGDNLLGIAIMQ